MLTIPMKQMLQRLRSGNLEIGEAAILEQIAAGEFISEMRGMYPVLFQERSIGRKLEIGLARSVQFEIVGHKPANSLFPAIQFFPVLRRCLFVSSYADSISEITTTARIRVRPALGNANTVAFKMGAGFKLDRTPDGWSVKPLKRRAVHLTEDLLTMRGWKFEVLVPFAASGPGPSRRNTAS